IVDRRDGALIDDAFIVSIGVFNPERRVGSRRSVIRDAQKTALFSTDVAGDGAQDKGQSEKVMALGRLAALFSLLAIQLPDVFYRIAQVQRHGIRRVLLDPLGPVGLPFASGIEGLCSTLLNGFRPAP